MNTRSAREKRRRRRMAERRERRQSEAKGGGEKTRTPTRGIRPPPPRHSDQMGPSLSLSLSLSRLLCTESGVLNSSPSFPSSQLTFSISSELPSSIEPPLCASTVHTPTGRLQKQANCIPHTAGSSVLHESIAVVSRHHSSTLRDTEPEHASDWKSDLTSMVDRRSVK